MNISELILERFKTRMELSKVTSSEEREILIVKLKNLEDQISEITHRKKA